MQAINQEIELGVVAWIAGQGGAALHLPRQPFGVAAGQQGTGAGGAQGPELGRWGALFRLRPCPRLATPLIPPCHG